ncbi:MAG TPA: hypothetical protein VGE93_22510 [Bryobacteraceae bacterium]
MTENAKNSTAQNTVQDPPEYNAGTDRNLNKDSDWLGGPQNGDEAPSTSTEGAYQTAAHSTGYTDQLGSADWLGGPQNGVETPREAARNPQTGDIQKPTEAGANVQGVDTQTGTQAKGMG